jgi:two-component system OmpR family response regulator
MHATPPDPTVLVVDDEETIHELFSKLLNFEGYVSLHARTLRDAKAMVHQGLVDAVILDLTLKAGESGLDVLIWLRMQREHIETPVFILTGQSHLSEYVEATIRRERAYVFYKGQPLAELLAHLRVVLNQSASV